MKSRFKVAFRVFALLSLLTVQANASTPEDSLLNMKGQFVKDDKVTAGGLVTIEDIVKAYVYIKKFGSKQCFAPGTETPVIDLSKSRTEVTEVVYQNPEGVISNHSTQDKLLIQKQEDNTKVTMKYSLMNPNEEIKDISESSFVVNDKAVGSRTNMSDMGELEHSFNDELLESLYAKEFCFGGNDETDQVASHTLEKGVYIRADGVQVNAILETKKIDIKQITCVDKEGRAKKFEKGSSTEVRVFSLDSIEVGLTCDFPQVLVDSHKFFDEQGKLISARRIEVISAE